MKQGSSCDVLVLFEEAEASMASFVETGLMGLRPNELELVLKGRLHQAVIIAHLDDRADRWTRVKSLTEDVLQFDFNNSHARWLRGHSLLHGSKKRPEALEEMRRAVECARTQGKASEAEQWESEIGTLFGSDAPPSADAAPADEPREAQDNETPQGAVPLGDPAASGVRSGMQKGFFNRRAASRTRAAAPKAAAAAPVAASQPLPEAAAVDVDTAASQELTKLRQQLSDFRREHQDAERRHQVWQRDLCAQLEVIGESVDEAIVAERANASGDEPALLASLGELRSLASELTDRLQGDRKWAEGEHRAFMDCSTEVMTLRTMTSRECKERQDTSKQQVSELKELAKRVGELKPSVKVLRDRAKQKLLAAGQEDDEPDLARAAERALEFRALPPSVRLRSLVNDVAVLRLMFFAFLLGMLLMLGVFIEVFGHYKCRFVCTR